VLRIARPVPVPSFQLSISDLAHELLEQPWRQKGQLQSMPTDAFEISASRYFVARGIEFTGATAQ
jgi:hypothetical protein